MSVFYIKHDTSLCCAFSCSTINFHSASPRNLWRRLSSPPPLFLFQDQSRGPVPDTNEHHGRFHVIDNIHCGVRIYVVVPCKPQILQSITAVIPGVHREDQPSIIAKYFIVYDISYLRLSCIYLCSFHDCISPLSDLLLGTFN